MRAGKGCKDHVARIWLLLRHRDSSQFFIAPANFFQLMEIQLRIVTLRVHIHRQRDDVNVPRPLADPEQRAFNPVGTGQYAKFCIANPAAAVIVRMDGQDNTVAIRQIFMDVFDLTGKNMRHRIFDRRWNVDDRFVFRCRLPNFQHAVANVQRVIDLGTRETFRTVLQIKIAGRLFRQLFQ